MEGPLMKDFQEKGIILLCSIYILGGSTANRSGSDTNIPFHSYNTYCQVCDDAHILKVVLMFYRPEAGGNWESIHHLQSSLQIQDMKNVSHSVLKSLQISVFVCCEWDICIEHYIYLIIVVILYMMIVAVASEVNTKINNQHCFDCYCSQFHKVTKYIFHLYLYYWSFVVLSIVLLITSA